MGKKQFGLTALTASLSKQSNDYLKQVQSELVEEEQESLKDFVKGAYRLLVEKEQEIKNLQEEVDKIHSAIDKATEGDWKALGEIRIPVRFFQESTLRKHGKSLLEGSSEIRMMELYMPDSKE
jgi:allophanate hydrolase subunit 1